MRLEIREFKEGRHLLVVFETPEESEMVDHIFGHTVKDTDGFISNVQGEVRLSDGYGEHYMFLHPPKHVPLQVREPHEYAQQFMQDPQPERSHENNPSSDVHGDSKDRS